MHAGRFVFGSSQLKRTAFSVKRLVAAVCAPAIAIACVSDRQVEVRGTPGASDDSEAGAETSDADQPSGSGGARTSRGAGGALSSGGTRTRPGPGGSHDPDGGIDSGAPLSSGGASGADGGAATGSGGTGAGGRGDGMGGTSSGGAQAAGGRITTGGAGGTSAGGAGGKGTGGSAGAGGTWTTGSNIDALGHLIPPASGAGIQIATSAVTVLPGQELFECYHAQVGESSQLYVGEWELLMTKAVVEVIVYRGGNDTTAPGTFTNLGCTSGFGGSTWLYYASYRLHTHLVMPDGVAMGLSPGERILFDLHFIDTDDTPIDAQVALNAYKAAGTTFRTAGAQVSFNTSVFIPPNGTQTVQGDCTPPAGASYFSMTTHTFKRGIDARATRKLANGQLGEVLVDTKVFDSPQESLWTSPSFLTFAQGETYHYSCAFQNDRSSSITVGTSADSNEQCMTVAYYFPTSSTTPACK